MPFRHKADLKKMYNLNFLALNVCIPICNVQCDAQNAKHRINISGLMQPPFKFWSSADQYRHLISVPKCSYYKTFQNNTDIAHVSVNYKHILVFDVTGRFVESSHPQLCNSVFNCHSGFFI